MKEIKLSNLRHLWLIDIDGTIVKHNSHLIPEQALLPGVIDFWQKIPPEDIIILLTARSEKYSSKTEEFLAANNIRYDIVLYNMPTGERILINDIKPRGLITAKALNVARDEGLTNIATEFSQNL